MKRKLYIDQFLPLKALHSEMKVPVSFVCFCFHTLLSSLIGAHNKKSCILSLQIGLRWNSLDDHHLDSGCQAVWVHEHSFLGPLEGCQRIIQRFDVYLGIDTGLENSGILVPRLVKTRTQLSSHASTYLILEIQQLDNCDSLFFLHSISQLPSKKKNKT